MTLIRKFIYAKDLNELREKERQLVKDQVDGLDTYAAGTATVNYVFDRYMSVKKNLRATTKTNYEYMYDHFIRINPTDGVMAEIKKSLGNKTNVRHALTIDQQRAFMQYVAEHPTYHHWWPLFAVLLGTGCRIGEVVGLRWQDVNLGKGIITINHSLVYYPTGNNRTSVLHVSMPKTEAGIRTIPILDVVRDALQMVKEQNKALGRNSKDVVVDGMSGFIFVNRYGTATNPQAVNRAIKRIVSDYNAEEELAAIRERRKPVLLPYFSAHILRHTFCTRLCENETNLKVIQSVMGHRDIQTTLDIYAEATEDKKKESFERLGAKMDVF